MAKKANIQKDAFKKYTKWIWTLFLSGIGFIMLLFLLASFGVFGKLPAFEELENPQNDLATQVISVDGKTIGSYFKENRSPIKYKDLPQNLVDALVATEDVRFYEHSGIDFKGTARAAIKLGRDGGASTITQQLAKLLFTRKPSGNFFKRIILQKTKEWIIAVRLERHYTKQEIIAMYFNKQGFLFQAVGIRSASRIYFGKEPKDLNIEESAVLVAMLKNPRQYNPYREISKEKSFQRRNVVLMQMERNDIISKKVKDSLQKLPIVLDFSPEDTSFGMATYFREYLRGFMKDWVKNNPKPDGSEYDIFRDGLKIYVTIDSRMQQYAEEAMEEHMSNLQRVFFKSQETNKTAPFYDLTKKEVDANILAAMKRSNRWRRMKKAGKSEKEIKTSFDEKAEMKIFSWKGEIDTIMTPKDSIRYYKHFMHTGILSTEPQTGHVKAWVGGINHKHFQYDHVKQGSRQVGSTFKPFVYATAINQLGYSPCKELNNTLYTIPKGKYGLPEDWTPHNSSEKYGGVRTLKDALANSVNVISAQLIDKATPKNVVRLANNLGIEKEIPEVPSIALGSVDLSLYEMVGAYNTFSNKGMYVEPIMVLRIEDKNGTSLSEFAPKTKEVLNEQAAYTVINLLEGVTQFGSGVRLRSSSGVYPDSIASGYPYKLTNPIAGKTGTTQNQSDGWFMGLVPNLTTGVWVGGEERAIHFPDLGRGQGASMALPIWALFMKKCYADKTLNVSKEEFEKPENMSIELDCEKYKNPETEGEKDPAEEVPEF
tara:strand:- start:471829 stop:474132 length:2304 start_codon:yes stop_codon:yes gene_type:complete